MSEYERDEARKGRCYFVAYVDPLTGIRKEDKFFPDRQEIQEISVTSNPESVLAFVEPKQSVQGAGVWVLSQVLRNTDQGLRVLLRAGPGKGREIVGKKFMPYDTKVISTARKNGLNVLSA
ncbi:hypothetical protein V5O48_005492 [Marasmius crinis-equi]|uniref:Uncharacterized protein n=1 Tax=Marasmius crinis-equi TaxID=585013 RepID=A0ABR3FM49_9AGAR